MIEHGTYKGYVYYGCQCRECRAAGGKVKQFCTHDDTLDELDSRVDICCNEAEPGSTYCGFHIKQHAEELYKACKGCGLRHRWGCICPCHLCVKARAEDAEIKDSTS